MSGLIGLADPAGVDPAVVEEAAGLSGFRGELSMECDPTAAFGVLTRPGGAAGLLRTEAGLLAADARIDADLSGRRDRPDLERSSGVSFLEAVLRQAGPHGLDEVAGDFALAWRRPDGVVVLARDAFSLRPLVWARSGTSVGFASDPDALLALGVATGDLDADAVADWVAHGDSRDERTAFRGVRRVLGGRWVAVHPDGRTIGGRWFRPERIGESRAPLDDHVERARTAIVEATRSRVRGGRATVLLTGGRDSGAVAAAVASTGADARAVTALTDPDPRPPEGHAARALAESVGLPWAGLPVQARLTTGMLDALREASGTPLGSFLPTALALQRGVRDGGAEVVLSGEGGEFFFAPPIALADLLRAGRFRAARSSLDAYRRDWHYPALLSARWTARALAPVRILRARERWRRRPTWVDGATRPGGREPARGAREHLVRRVIGSGRSSEYELLERLFARAGAQFTCPLLDARVVRIALSLPVEHLLPHPEPKVVLGRALLGDLAPTRVKADYSEFFDRLARQAQMDFPEAFAPGNLTAQLCSIDEAGLRATADPRWRVASMPLLVVGSWLRAKERS